MFGIPATELASMSDLWDLVWGKPHVDPAALARAIEAELRSPDLDYRTRLLIRDGTNALEQYWGWERLSEWMSNSPVRARLEAIRKEDLGSSGFPLLKEQLMNRTEPETVKEFLRELGSRIETPAKLVVGGSIALILTGNIARATADIDVVDEVPEPIRNKHELLEDLKQRYRLLLTHFQSHYLPKGWEDRLEHFGQFGSINVYTVNAYDIFVGKLFSNRTKDLDDLRAMKPLIDKQKLHNRLSDTTASLMNDPSLRHAARHNWYILFGEDLPT
jgi:hypothetical protein